MSSRERIVGNVLQSYQPTLVGIHWNIPNFLTLVKDFEKGNISFIKKEISSSDGNWIISLDPKERLDGKIWISLKGKVKKNSVTCYVGSQKAEFRQSAVFECRKESESQNVWNHWIFTATSDLDSLKRCKSKLLPSGNLSVSFYFNDDQQDPPTVESWCMTGLENLSSGFEDLFVKRKNTDVTIKVGDKDFPVHKFVLMARSPVFSAMFEHDTSEERTGMVTVSDCDLDSFESFLYHLYTGKFDRVTPTNVHHLYVTSDKYAVQALKSFCVFYMSQNLTVENVSDVALLADRFGEFELLSAVQDFFKRNSSKVTPTSQWKNLMEEDSELPNRLLRTMEEECL